MRTLRNLMETNKKTIKYIEFEIYANNLISLGHLICRLKILKIDRVLFFHYLRMIPDRFQHVLSLIKH